MDTGSGELSGAVLLERARALEPLVRAHAEEGDRERRLSLPVVRALADAGLFRIAVARSLGGAEAHPFDQIRVIEAISEADGAAGWALMIGIETLGLGSVALARETAEEVVLKRPEVIFSGALNPLGRAWPVPGGYRVSGQWPFASGCTHSHYFYGQCVVMDGERPAAGAQGPERCDVLIPASEYRVVDTWHTAGLRGSGSHDVAVTDVFVPERFATGAARATESGPLFRLPFYSRLAYNKVGVATGIARAALDHFADLAARKTPRGTSAPLRERAHAQASFAEAEFLLRSARAFVLESVGELWAATLAGETPTRKQRALVQLACSRAASAAARAVEIVHAAAGSTANFTASPLERCFRDVHVVGQHIMVSPALGDAAGRRLLGLESGTPFF
jgi:alkylation response protein AidB-like acyl-CoA dehydrogenase